MTEINNLFSLDWQGFVTTVFVIMASLIAIAKIIDEFIKLCRRFTKKGKQIVEDNPTNQKQDLEIEQIKARQDAFEENLNIIKESVMIAMWDRIVHFGLNYIERGHITLAEKDIFTAQVRSYKRSGGNGHLVKFAPLVENLPLSENLTVEETELIESDTVARQKRVDLAKASLSSYYGK